jgi:anthranilate phosphoribosyltransferase
VIFNAGIGFFTNGMVSNIPEGIKLATDSIMSGKALEKLEAIIEFSTNACKQEVV